jgi:putative transposase
MSYDALRNGRHSHPHCAYCITTVTRSRLPLFNNFVAARLLINEIRHINESGSAISLAWVVMPDHLHWLFQLQQKVSLANVVKTLKARSALAINQHLAQSGGIWQRAYYDRGIRKDEDIRQIARYIVANPLRAGLVQDIGDYPHWDCVWMTERGVGSLD